MIKSTVPPLFRHAHTTINAVMWWADHVADCATTETHDLLITGGTGRGKTHQAYAAIKRIAFTLNDRDHHQISWTVAPSTEVTWPLWELLGLDPEHPAPMLDSSHIERLDDAAWFRQWLAPCVLVLDGIDPDPRNDRRQPAARVFTEILERRRALSRPTMITTSRRQHQLPAALGDTLAGLLAGVTTVDLQGPDRRLVAASERWGE